MMSATFVPQKRKASKDEDTLRHLHGKKARCGMITLSNLAEELRREGVKTKRCLADMQAKRQIHYVTHYLRPHL